MRICVFLKMLFFVFFFFFHLFYFKNWCKDQKTIAEQTQSHNRQLHLRMDELRRELKELESELNTEHNKVISEPKAPEIGANAVFSEYPPESTVIENLLQAQVEFYFSDYNLKRDKRLLMEVDRLPNKGYLPIDHVMKLARIRQLCSESHILIAALERSKILSLKKIPKTDKNNDKNNDNNNGKANGKDNAGKFFMCSLWIILNAHTFYAK